MLVPLLAGAMLLVICDLHSLAHHRQNLEFEAAEAAHHPEPVHLDTALAPHDLACLACQIGPKNQGRPAESPDRAGSEDDRGHRIAAISPAPVADLSHRLPLSRGPPLS
ncbi:MAG: hypothetical protein GY719_28310 [bacterium]|nr:hypothetical protein [bacterium]